MKKYEGEIFYGKFKFRGSAALAAWKKDISEKPDGPYWLPEPQPIRDKAHWEQFKYYRGGIVPVVHAFICNKYELDPLIYTEQDCHETLLQTYSGKDTPLGRIVALRTSDMDTAEMHKYCESIRNGVSAEWDLYIMDPEEWKSMHPEKYYPYPPKE